MDSRRRLMRLECDKLMLGEEPGFRTSLLPIVASRICASETPPPLICVVKFCGVYHVCLTVKQLSMHKLFT